MNMELLFMVGMMLLIAVPLSFIPYWTRKTESFGTAIPEEYYWKPELKKMRSRFALLAIIIHVLLLAVFLILGTLVYTEEQSAGVLLGVILFLQLAGNFLLYLSFYKKMKQKKASWNLSAEKTGMLTVDTKFRKVRLIYSNTWFLISFLMAAATILITFKYYGKIPEKIPMQYDFSGNVTSWAEKSYRSVLALPAMQLLMTALFIFINTIIDRAKQQISAANPEKSLQQNIIFRRRWSLYMIVSGSLLVLMFALIQFNFIFELNPTLVFAMVMVLVVLMVIGAIVLSVTTGQGGSRVKGSPSESGEQKLGRDDDKYWKLGVFYFNRQDPAIFIEKRFGIGWSNNWAHPISWVFIIVILVVFVAVPLLLL